MTIAALESDNGQEDARVHTCPVKGLYYLGELLSTSLIRDGTEVQAEGLTRNSPSSRNLIGKVKTLSKRTVASAIASETSH